MLKRGRHCPGNRKTQQLSSKPTNIQEISGDSWVHLCFVDTRSVSRSFCDLSERFFSLASSSLTASIVWFSWKKEMNRTKKVSKNGIHEIQSSLWSCFKEYNICLALRSLLRCFYITKFSLTYQVSISRDKFISISVFLGQS